MFFRLRPGLCIANTRSVSFDHHAKNELIRQEILYSDASLDEACRTGVIKVFNAAAHALQLSRRSRPAKSRRAALVSSAGEKKMLARSRSPEACD